MTATVLNSFFVNQDGEVLPLQSGLYATFGEIGWGVPDDVIISDHVSRAQSLLIEQFKRKFSMNGMVEAIVVHMQELENVFNNLLTLRSISQAVGAQLDGIGEIVGQDRDGRNDEEYRDAIRFRIFINKSSGEPETLVQFVLFITEASKVRIQEFPRATVQIFTDGSFIPDNIIEAVEAVSATGVNIEYVGASYNTLPFVFADDITGGVNPDGGGLNEIDYAPGGVELGGQIVEGYTN